MNARHPRRRCGAVALRTTLSALPIVCLLSCGRAEPEPAPPLRPVRAETVFATGAARQRTFSGMARSGTESTMSFKVGGTVQSVDVQVGDTVRAGDLIARIEDTDMRLRVEDAQAALVQAKAQERNASTEYARVRGLYENRNASAQDLDAARTAHESAGAAVESIAKKLELARRQLGYCRLTAPIAGSIASVTVEVNENVQPGQPICLLTSGSDIEVEVAIPEVLISGIREGDAVQVAFDALPDRSFAGRVTEVGVAATGLATTFPITVRLTDSTDTVLSGMAAEVTLTFGGGDGAPRLIVNPVAVGEDQSGRFVWIVTAAAEPGVGIVERRPVVVGELSNRGLEILDGVEDGETVVTAGVSKLTDGQRVRFDAAEVR